MSNYKQKAILDPGVHFPLRLKELLQDHGKVKVKGVGIFEIKNVPARKGFNPYTKQPMRIQAYKKITFRPTAKLKSRFN